MYKHPSRLAAAVVETHYLFPAAFLLIIHSKEPSFLVYTLLAQADRHISPTDKAALLTRLQHQKQRTETQLTDAEDNVGLYAERLATAKEAEQSKNSRSLDAQDQATHIQTVAVEAHDAVERLQIKVAAAQLKVVESQGKVKKEQQEEKRAQAYAMQVQRTAASAHVLAVKALHLLSNTRKDVTDAVMKWEEAVQRRLVLQAEVQQLDTSLEEVEQFVVEDDEASALASAAKIQQEDEQRSKGEEARAVVISQAILLKRSEATREMLWYLLLAVGLLAFVLGVGLQVMVKQ